MPRLRLVFVSILAGTLAARGEGAELTSELRAALSRTHGTELVWVYLRDKGPAPAPPVALTAHAAWRRAQRGHTRGATAADVPLAPGYVDAVRARVRRLRQQSRWLNAVSAEATPAEVEALARLPFVERLDVVRRYRRREEVGELHRAAAASVAAAGPAPHALDYGPSLGQAEMLHVPALHDRGLHGEGVIVAVFDAGFDNLGHEALSGLTIAATRDFVNGDDDVGDGPDRGRGSHGTATLSTLAGFLPGRLIGPAYAAVYLLAKTEDTDSETPVEEDNWAAAAEWAEALGADVISSSLGYLEFDPGFPSYTPQLLDGRTAVSTRAAELAVERGVVVVSSAGNAGFSALQNTLGAPADGIRVLAVAAVDSRRVRASFSSVGPTPDGRIKPDLAAQGALVVTAASGSAQSYGFFNGTSFSCPLVAGVAALVLQAHPAYTAEQVAAVLRGTASQAAAPDNLLGWGVVDASAAVDLPQP